MAKSAKYSSKEETDELEALSDRLASDLRRSIRQLGSHPLLSEAWMEMAEICGRIANVSDMESKLSASKDDATLWETEEQALRFLLEDGKLNLCLRNLVDYKREQRISQLEGSGSILDNIAQCDKFEKGLGVVLRNAWTHVEALQTTDLSALLNYIADVIDNTLAQPAIIESHMTAGDIHQRQEILVFYYLTSLLRQLDSISESRYRILLYFTKDLSELLSITTVLLVTAYLHTFTFDNC